MERLTILITLLYSTVILMLLFACQEDSSSTKDISTNPYTLTSLHYGNNNILSVSGDSYIATYSPVLNPKEATATYALNSVVAGINIAITQSTGILTIRGTITSADNVVVTATGTKSYSGQATATIVITSKTLFTDLGYGTNNTLTILNTQTAISFSPTLTPPRATAIFTLDSLVNGVTIHNDTGLLTIDGTIAGLNGKTAIVAATGTGDYAGIANFSCFYTERSNITC